VKRKDEAKAKEILAATLAVVDEQGIAGLSMEAVARRAGVATGTLYVYHAGKEALLEAAYVATKRAMAQAVFRDDGLPVRPAFLRMAEAYLAYLVEHRAEIAFLDQVRLSTFLSDEARAATADSTAVIAQLLERGKREQLLKELDTPLLIAFLHGAMREVAPELARLPAARRAARREQVALLCWDALTR